MIVSSSKALWKLTYKLPKSFIKRDVYAARIFRDKETGQWWSDVPDFAGCYSMADTLESLKQRFIEGLVLRISEEKSTYITEPTAIDKIARTPSFEDVPVGIFVFELCILNKVFNYQFVGAVVQIKDCIVNES